MITVRLSRDTTVVPIAKPKAKRSRPGKALVRLYSRRGANRFRRQLQATCFTRGSTFAVTLKFPPGTTPPAAMDCWNRWIRWVRRLWPTCYGYRSVEFAADQIHYHLIISEGMPFKSNLAARTGELADRWAKLSGTDPRAFFFEPVRNLVGYIRYPCEG